MTADETLRAYTHWSAFASFREEETGILAEGRWADLTIMDIDPFQLSETNPGAILDGEILMTVVAGRPVFRAEDF
jgi:predicted amidohydrolase YtcJ